MKIILLIVGLICASIALCFTEKKSQAFWIVLIILILDALALINTIFKFI